MADPEELEDGLGGCECLLAGSQRFAAPRHHLAGRSDVLAACAVLLGTAGCASAVGRWRPEGATWAEYVAIDGFGRIGRPMARIALEGPRWGRS